MQVNLVLWAQKKRCYVQGNTYVYIVRYVMEGDD